MTDYICKFTLKKLYEKSIINEEDMEIYGYGLKLLISTIFKVLGFLAVGIFTGLLEETIIFILFFSSLRIQAGGYHAKTVIGCFLGTLVLIFTSIVLVKILPVDYTTYFILITLVVSNLLIFIYAPLENKNKPFTDEEKVVYKHRSILVAIIGSFIILASIGLGQKFVYLGTIASASFLLELLTLINFRKNI